MAKNFLDSTGLNSLWSKICSIFAPKWLAYRPSDSAVGTNPTQNTITFISAGIDGEKGKNKIVTLNAATATKAGLLSAEDKGKIDSLGGSLAAASVYKSGISPTTIAMPVDVGGIEAGTTVADLNDKTFSQLFDNLLFPSMDPTYTGPSVSGFVLNNAATPVEIGTVARYIKTAASLYRGEWTTYNIQSNGTNLPAVGTATSTTYEIKINGSTSTTVPTSEDSTKKYTVLGDQTYKVTINYGKGPNPKDNKGTEKPDLARPAGSVTSTRTINVSAPIYATISNIGTFTKVSETLTKWTNTAITSPEFTLVAQSDNSTIKYYTKQAILIPYPSNRNTTVKIEFYNPNSGKWENHTSQFIMKDKWEAGDPDLSATNTANSLVKKIFNNTAEVNYRYYYFNSQNSIGARKFRITF